MGIVIVVQQGMVVEVYSDDPNTNVEVCDFDDLTLTEEEYNTMQSRVNDCDKNMERVY